MSNIYVYDQSLLRPSIRSEQVLPNGQTRTPKQLSTVDIDSSKQGHEGPADDHHGHLLKHLVIATIGLIFGFAAEKSKVFVPSVIHGQMAMQEFTMLKSFLSATTTSALCFIVLAMLPDTSELFEKIRKSFSSCVETKQIFAFIIGGVILGMGMTLCGACPGMVFVQIGSGVSNAVYTLGGCFCGALVYGLVEPTLRGWLTKPTAHHSSAWIHELFGFKYVPTALVFAILLGSITMLTDVLVPWRTEQKVSPIEVGIFQQISWSPIIGGILMGSLQLGVGLTVKDSLGGSSSYCTVLSRLGLSKLIPYFESYRSGIGNWWQVFYWFGAIGGAGLSSYLSGTQGGVAGVTPLLGLVGGFFMVFGARLASGCTSGHGLSGLGLLSLPSFVAVPAMFAGGMGLEWVIRGYL